MEHRKEIRINRERILETFARLVEIDSPSYDERQMCDELKRRLEGLGLVVEEDDSAGRSGSSCGNLIARLEGREDLPPILFSSHMDTVDPARGKKAVVYADGRITSRGDTVLGADDCSGLAAILEALEVIRENELAHNPLEIVFTTGEEVYGRGASQLDMSRLEAKDAYVFDLTGECGRAAFRAPSIIFFQITVKGRASHAGFAPERGIHAVRIAAEAIGQLKSGHVDEETTVNIGTINGGLAANIVPESCVVTGEVRGYDHEKAIAQVTGIIQTFERTAAAAGGQIESKTEVCIKAYRTDRDSRAVRRFERACRRMGAEPLLDETFGGSDLNVLAQRGIEGLVVASAMEQCHTCSEYTTVDELCRTGQMALELMIADACL